MQVLERMGWDLFLGKGDGVRADSSALEAGQAAARAG